MKPILLIILTCNALLLQCTLGKKQAPKEKSYKVAVTNDNNIYTITGSFYNEVVYSKFTTAPEDTTQMKEEAFSLIEYLEEEERKTLYDYNR
jgi:hypothetical protein